MCATELACLQELNDSFSIYTSTTAQADLVTANLHTLVYDPNALTLFGFMLGCLFVSGLRLK